MDNSVSSQAFTENTQVSSENSETHPSTVSSNNDSSPPDEQNRPIVDSSDGDGRNAPPNYGWVPEEKSNDEKNTNEDIDSIDNGLPSYISATAQPSAPPLSPQHFAEELISPDHSVQNSSINAGSPNLEQLNLNDDQGNENIAKIFRSEVKKISLKINLIKAAKQLLNFLKEVDKAEDLYEGKKVKAALYR